MSNPYDPPSADNVIRITSEEAMSDHVDDLLSRQASMMGEQGMTAKRRRRWYYSNWFVFFVAGTLGAVLAIGALEPYFDDMPYIQGTISQVNPSGGSTIPVGNGQMVTLPAVFVVDVNIDGNRIRVPAGIKKYNEDDTVEIFDPNVLAAGQEVGFHLELMSLGAGPPIAVAQYVVLDPPASRRTNATLEDMEAQQTAMGLLFFPIIAAAIGFAIAAADGLMCRLWRRLVLGGLVGLIIGFVGGFVSSILAGLIYMPISQMAMEQNDGSGDITATGFMIQMSGRALAWCLAGMAMGLGQGVSLRSGRLLLYGFLGGAIGGLLGGLLFDPIDLLLLGMDKPSAHVSRFIGIAIIGAFVGLTIGIVELLARDAWLQMIQGPLSGKEFLVFKDTIAVGASPRSDIYLFNDEDVADHHATIRSTADQYELETVDPTNYPVLINGRQVQRSRLRHGDQITLGKTIFTFQRRTQG